ncbi:MAG TPA: site-2 protease family protein [Dehalococcoidia bacterium]|nr:site-2 protease family protein [Dehalococcoidia bacterium]
MGGTLTIGRIAGFQIRIHFSWIIVLALLIWSLGASEFPSAYPHWSQAEYWVTAVIASLLLFVSVLVHELSHSLVARARGLPVSSITLYIFGGVSQIEQEARTPGVEFAIAVVGPLASLVIGGICLAISPLAGNISEPVKATLIYLGTVNLLLGIFNLLPGFPLDGGRVLRSLVWRATGSPVRGTVVAASVGRLIGFLMIIGGVIATFSGAGFSGLWIAFIGWFLDNAASASLQQTAVHGVLSGARVADAMTTDFKTVVPALPVEALVEEYIQGSHQRSFPVFGGGTLWGIVSLTDVAHLPRDRWAETPVERIMTPRERVKTTTSDTPIEQALPALQRSGVKQLVVLGGEPERVVGLLSRADVMDYLQVRHLLAQQV